MHATRRNWLLALAYNPAPFGELRNSRPCARTPSRTWHATRRADPREATVAPLLPLPKWHTLEHHDRLGALASRKPTRRSGVAGGYLCGGDGESTGHMFHEDGKLQDQIRYIEPDLADPDGEVDELRWDAVDLGNPDL